MTQPDQWVSRPMIVTVWDRCDECETLATDVSKREYWQSYARKYITSCSKCYERVKNEKL